MINFDNVEALVTYMFEKINDDDPVTVVVDKDLAIETMKELLEYKNVALEIADIDSFEYDKEYYVTLLYDDEEFDCWRVSVEKAYNDVLEKYFGIDGYVLFHEDVNSRSLVDIQNNENVEMSGHDWFMIGEDECFESDDEYNGTDEVEDTAAADTDSGVDSKKCGATVKGNMSIDDAVDLVKEIEHSVMHISEMFDEMNMFRRLLGW